MADEIVINGSDAILFQGSKNILSPERRQVSITMTHEPRPRVMRQKVSVIRTRISKPPMQSKMRNKVLKQNLYKCSYI